MTSPSIKLQEKIPRADRVLLFGELLIDDFVYQRLADGAPFNIARHLRAFGLHPSLISRVGDDTDGDELMAALDGFGIDIAWIQIDSNFQTGNVRIHMQGNGHTFEIFIIRHMTSF